MPNLSLMPINLKLAPKVQIQKISHISYNRLGQTLTRDFKEKKKRNIIKPRDITETPILWLSVLKQPILVRFTRTYGKLSIIIVAEKDTMLKTVLNSKPILQITSNQLKQPCINNCDQNRYYIWNCLKFKKNNSKDQGQLYVLHLVFDIWFYMNSAIFC